MAIVDRVLGKNAYISWAGQVVQASYRSLNIDASSDVVEVSAGSDANKSYIASLKDGTVQLSYMYEGTAGTAITTNFKVGTSGTLLWGPEGTAAGKPKGGLIGIVTAHSKPMTYNEAIMRTVTIQQSGTILFNDEVDVWP